MSSSWFSISLKMLDLSFTQSCFIEDLSFSVKRIHPLQLELVIWERHLVVKAVALPALVWDVHGDRTTSEEHPHVAVLWREYRWTFKQGKEQRGQNQETRANLSQNCL